jgi:chaperonin cofactor prefoldin
MASPPKFQSWSKVRSFVRCSLRALSIQHLHSTDHHEHELVLSAMVALEPTRKCFRLVGGVLVERTVAEVHPAVTSNKEKIKSVIESLRYQTL